MAKFNDKTWNPTVFEKYMQKAPNTKENALVKNGLLDNKPNTRARLTEQVGGNYIVEPIKGLLDGEVQNYDGQTDVEFTSRDTFEQGKIIIGRMKGWEEIDFSSDLTGVNWMADVAAEVKEYYDEVDQADLLAILEGIFAMNSNTVDQNFVKNHTYEVTGDVDATTMNSALQQASGDKKKQFRVAFMHSAVATTLENLNLLEYLKYTDAAGITRDLSIGTYNGKLVIVDDDMPVSEEGEYTTYVMGEKFFEYDNIPLVANEASEMARDAVKNGGVTKLITRRRKLVAPKFISFTKKQMATDSPTVEELKKGENWTIANNGKSGAQLKAVADKMIPLVRIISNKQG